MRSITARPSRLPVALTLVSLALPLGACGVLAQPKTEPSSYVVASAGPAEPSASSFAETNDPASKTEPTVQAAQARAAAETFAKTSLTHGYPSKTYADSLSQLKPLMTPSAFAAHQRADRKRGDPEKQAAQLYKQRIRVVPRLTAVKVATVQHNDANVDLDARLFREQQRSGKWVTAQQIKTVHSTLTLTKREGSWLVDEVR